jgi:hypothetical protein
MRIFFFEKLGILSSYNTPLAPLKRGTDLCFFRGSQIIGFKVYPGYKFRVRNINCITTLQGAQGAMWQTPMDKRKETRNKRKDVDMN